MYGDTFQTVKHLSEPVYKMPKSVQQSIPVSRVSRSGIFEIEKKKGEHLYDRAYLLDDVNYSTKDEEERTGFLLQMSKIFNSMNVDWKMLVVNQKRDIERLIRELLPEKCADPLYQSMVRAYGQILQWRLNDGNTSIEQVKYLVVSCRKQDFESAKVFFQALEQRLRILFHSLGGNLVPLDGTARLKSLHSLYRLGREEEFDLDWEGMQKAKRNWRNEICSLSIRETSSYLEFDDKYTTTLFCKVFPNSIPDGFIRELANVPFHLMVSMDVVPIPQEVTLRKLENAYTNNEQAIAREQEEKNRRHAFSSDISYPKRKKKEELEGYLDQVHNNDEKLYYLGFLVTVIGKDLQELKDNAANIRSIASGYSMVFDTLEMRQMKGFNTCLPTAAREVDVLRTLFTTSLAAFLPYNVQEIMDKDGFFYGINQVSRNPIIINRKNMMNPHSFIFGKTGSGKSMFEKNEIGQILFNTDEDIFIMDPQNEYFDIVRNLGGQIIDFSNQGDVCMNPWEIPEPLPEGFGEDDFIASKSAMTRAICKEMLVPTALTGVHRTVIDRCVKEWYRGIFRKRRPKSETLIELREFIGRQEEPEAREIYIALEMFTHGSLNVFARKSNVNIHNRFVTFGLKNLGKEMKRIATLIASELIRSRIEYNSKGVLVPSGKRKKTRKLVATNVIVDEFQIITQEELGREIFDNLYRTVRKQGGIMTCLTQTLSDNLLQAEMQAMLSNSEFIVLLNQSGIDRNILKQIYPEISEEEIRYVTNAKVGSGLIKCGDKVVPFDCELPKDNLLYALYNTNFYEQELHITEERKQE